MNIKITNKHRIMCFILTLIGVIGYFISLIFCINFIIDKNYFDGFTIMGRIGKNQIFNVCDYYDCGSSSSIKYFINFFLIGIFWYYQIYHNSLSKFLFTKYSNYKLLSKSIYSIINSITTIQMILLWQPINHSFYNFENYYIVSAYSFLYYASFTIHLLSLSIVWDSDLLGLSILKSVMLNDEIKYPKNVKTQFSWLYKTCRHPMQGSFMGLMIYSSPQYSNGKLFFIILFSIGIWIGILVDEVYMMNHQFYRKYMILVNNRFIPDILNPFSRNVQRILN